MRTTLNIDEKALKEALKMAQGKTKSEIVNDALREYARRRKVREFLKFEGKMVWEGNLDERS
ncbi:MAG: type II toxin-antitoxin system VapB family antitoxin [Thermoanaerobaculia bacterium]